MSKFIRSNPSLGAYHPRLFNAQHMADVGKVCTHNRVSVFKKKISDKGEMLSYKETAFPTAIRERLKSGKSFVIKHNHRPM